MLTKKQRIEIMYKPLNKQLLSDAESFRESSDYKLIKYIFNYYEAEKLTPEDEQCVKDVIKSFTKYGNETMSDERFDDLIILFNYVNIIDGNLKNKK